jgi:predicted RNase H-like nuclease (RuvC/YqgF family)
MLLAYLDDNSTRILSTNQIYEIGQYGPITFVLKKLPRKFSLVKIATKNFQQNVSTWIFYFLFYLFKALVPKLKIQLL